MTCSASTSTACGPRWSTTSDGAGRASPESTRVRRRLSCCTSARRAGAASPACSSELRDAAAPTPATPGALARLFPVVHPDDPEREAEYQRLMRDELVASRLGRHRRRRGGARRRPAVARSPLDEAELLAFVQAVNGVRLVLGTVLDVVRGRRPSTHADRARRQPPSTTSTATCRGCSTRPCGRCPRPPLILRRPERSAGAAERCQVERSGPPLLVSRCSQLDERSAPIV